MRIGPRRKLKESPGRKRRERERERKRSVLFVGNLWIF